MNSLDKNTIFLFMIYFYWSYISFI